MKIKGKMTRRIKRKLAELAILIMLAILAGFTDRIADSAVGIGLQAGIYAAMLILIADLGGFFGRKRIFGRQKNIDGLEAEHRKGVEK